MKIRRGLVLSNLTDVGLERTQNEDYYGYFEPQDDADFAQKGRLVIVADGMGGHRAGQVASRLAVETIRDAYAASQEDNPQQALVDAFQVANQSIYHLSRSQPALQGMGTTCSALLLKDDHAYFAHVGDSRIYLVREEKILQMTRDHSVVMEKVREGLLTRDEARHQPDRNLISRAIGVSPTVEVDASPWPIPTYEGDVFALCSDGLSTLVRDEEIRDLLIQKHPREACRTLVDLAKFRGGYDNITLQIVKLIDELKETKEYEMPPQPAQKRRKRMLFILLAVLFLIILLAGATLYFQNRQPSEPTEPQSPPSQQTPSEGASLAPIPDSSSGSPDKRSSRSAGQKLEQEMEG